MHINVHKDKYWEDLHPNITTVVTREGTEDGDPQGL